MKFNIGLLRESMRKRFLHLLVGMFICIFPQFSAIAQETVFANYFDIPTDSSAGTEVTGRIHLERNKDVLTRPIPKGYRFEIIKQPEDKLFRIDSSPDTNDSLAQPVIKEYADKQHLLSPSQWYHIRIQVEEFSSILRSSRKRRSGVFKRYLYDSIAID